MLLIKIFSATALAIFASIPPVAGLPLSLSTAKMDHDFYELYNVVVESPFQTDPQSTDNTTVSCK